MHQMERLRRGFARGLDACGLIAGAATFGVMCLVVANALLRFAFNAPIAGALEITEAALPVMVFLSLALTQAEGGHIKVVLLTRRLPAPMQRALVTLAMALGAILFAWAAYAGWIMAAKSFAIHEMERGSIRFALWPVKGVVFVGLALLSVQFALDAAYSALGGGLKDAEGDA